MRRSALGLFVLVAAAGLVRLAAARDDLWLDELWSLRLAAGISRASGVFTSIHLDNNHYLVTLWMFLLGPDAGGFWYRLPSVLAGTAAVALAAAAGRRLGRTAGIFAALLTAFSLPLVVYSSEARGYALAVCLALASFLLLGRVLDRGRPADAVVFGAVASLGLLAHLTYGTVLLAAAVWAAWRLLGRGGGPRVRPGVVGAAFLLPGLALVALWAVDLRHLEIGGGNPASSFEAVAQMASLLLGGPEDARLGAFLLPVVGAGVLLGLNRLRRTDPGAAAFLLVGSAFPFLSLALPHSEFVHWRYVLVAVPFVFLSLGVLLDGVWSRGAAGKVCAGACLAGILAGDAHRILSFLPDGRGRYADAVRLMASGVPGPSATVASDHDFRNGMAVEYFARRLALPRPVIYVRKGDAPAGGTDWFLTHSDSPSPPHRASMADPAGNRYVFEKEFPFAGVSGFWWTLYRRAGTGETSSAR